MHEQKRAFLKLERKREGLTEMGIGGDERRVLGTRKDLWWKSNLLLIRDYLVGEAAASASLRSFTGGAFQPARASNETPY